MLNTCFCWNNNLAFAVHSETLSQDPAATKWNTTASTGTPGGSTDPVMLASVETSAARH